MFKMILIGNWHIGACKGYLNNNKYRPNRLLQRRILVVLIFRQL